MTAKTKQTKSRKRYPQQRKDEALALDERFGIGSAAKQLGIHEA